MKKDSSIYLKHILESIILLEKYLKGVTKDQFINSKEKQDLAIRRLEIIGEATKNLPQEFREKHPITPWKRMTGMRDVLIHEYFEVDYPLIWKTVKEFIPPLKEQIEELLKK